MKKNLYQTPHFEAIEIKAERGFALSPSLKDWNNDGTDHGGDAE